MSGNQQPKIQVTVTELRTLRDVQEWAAIAESIGVPESSLGEASSINRSIQVTAYLTQVGPAADFEVEPCHDTSCTLGEHTDDSKHFDGQVAW